jgi:hypothetical protein
MRRRLQGLHQADRSTDRTVPNGMFLVCVQRAHYHWHVQKPFYVLRFVVLEPPAFEGRTFSGRVYCSAKALWRFSWFLQDFGYDSELMGRDEVDDKNLVGLRGVVKIRHAVLNGATLLSLDAFGPSSQWEELTMGSSAPDGDPEAA